MLEKTPEEFDKREYYYRKYAIQSILKEHTKLDKKLPEEKKYLKTN